MPGVMGLREPLWLTLRPTKRCGLQKAGRARRKMPAKEAPGAICTAPGQVARCHRPSLHVTITV